MAKRQTYVIGVLGLLLGMALGTNSVPDAQADLYSTLDPNSESVRTMPHLRRAAGIIRRRSDENTSSTVFRLTAPRRVPFTEGYISIVREERLNDLARYGAAPMRSTRRVVPGCAVYRGDDYTRCLEQLIQSDEY